MAGLAIHRGEEFGIAQEICQKWQQSIDVMAKVFDVPAALIMRVDQKDIEVFLSSRSVSNPYAQGEKASLNTGLYCETVMRTEEQLLVPNALDDPDWDHNPDIELNMISYLGAPLRWPDGCVFGTICVLDNKANSYTSAYTMMLQQFCELIEKDLRQTVQVTQLKNTVSELESTRTQLLASQKIAAQSRVVSGLAHAINTPIGISVTGASHGLAMISKLLSAFEKDIKDDLTKENIIDALADIEESLVLVENNLKKSVDVISRIRLASSIDLESNKDLFSLKCLLCDIVGSFDQVLESKDYRINISCSEDITLQSYAGAYREIFTNLIDNSICHGFNGRISGEINIHAEKYENRLEIRYSDDGLGFEVNDKKSVFEPFRELKGMGAKVGVGLNIIYNKVTQDLKGTIDCQSGPGTGVLFTIILDVS